MNPSMFNDDILLIMKVKLNQLNTNKETSIALYMKRSKQPAIKVCFNLFDYCAFLKN